ncbi:MAG: hypothetical protein JO121_10925 [Deltaproteobacteria bacterium]|nr:hypothetical protein [Deltaproteobacteria bacterium]
MRFALTVLASERSWELPKAEVDKIVAEHVKLVSDLKAAGKLINVYRLRPGREAKTIRVRNGRRVIEDGPFTGTEEAVGAFYLIQSDSHDEAMAWADNLAIFDWESIEVRRLWTD